MILTDVFFSLKTSNCVVDGSLSRCSGVHLCSSRLSETRPALGTVTASNGSWTAASHECRNLSAGRPDAPDRQKSVNS